MDDKGNARRRAQDVSKIQCVSKANTFIFNSPGLFSNIVSLRCLHTTSMMSVVFPVRYMCHSHARRRTGVNTFCILTISLRNAAIIYTHSSFLNIFKLVQLEKYKHLTTEVRFTRSNANNV